MGLMFKKLFKICLVLGVSFVLLSIVGWFGVKYISTAQAVQKANVIIEGAYQSHNPQNDDEKVIALVTEVFDSFGHISSSKEPLLRIRGYLTNKRLPEFLRLRNGVIETHVQKGLCDNAARMLAFLLEEEGFESVQWNMVTDTMGHSALSVSMKDGREVFVDPFYGYVALDERGNLDSLGNAQKRLRSSTRLGKVLRSLGDKSTPKFYNGLRRMSMAAEGQDLVIEAALPKVTGSPLFIGAIDQSSKDMKDAGKSYKMTPYWNYMGHRYNREWVRILRAEQAVRLVITLTEPVEKGVLTMDKKPQIEGKDLIWTLGVGEQITFRDGLAKISFKRLNSYIPVDQITISPL